MKNIRLAICVFSLIISMLTTAIAQSGGNFTLTKSVVASGGGASSGGVFSVESTIGQPIAGGVIGNDPFTLFSGFWEPQAGAGQQTLQFSSGLYTIGEASPMATITVTRLGGSGGAVSVNYSTANGTATGGATCASGIDYLIQNGTLSWPNGDSSSRTFIVPICNDPLPEGDETINLGLATPTGGAVRGIQSTAVLTITDNDTAGTPTPTPTPAPTPTPTATPTPTPIPGGLEGDLAGRFTGDGLYRANDLQVMRDFFAGTLEINPAFNEFQRTDCAPYETQGNGRIDAADVQQMRNYIATLSEPQSAGGPLEPVTAPPTTTSLFDDEAEKAGRRTMRVNSVHAMAGEKVTVFLELDSQGDEVAMSFTLNFDPEKLGNPVVEIGAGVPAGTILTVNTTDTAGGRIGILLDSGDPFARAPRGAIVTVTFNVAAKAESGPTLLSFDDSLIYRGISNVDARLLVARYEAGFVTIMETVSLDEPAEINGDVSMKSESPAYLLNIPDEGAAIAPRFKRLARRFAAYDSF